MPPKRTKTTNNNNKGEVPDPAAAPAEASATTTTEKKGRKRRADSGEKEASASENTDDNAAASLPPPTKKTASTKASSSTKSTKRTKKDNDGSASGPTNPATCVPATLYCFGQNDCGQIGLGEDVQQRKFPALVPGLETKKMIGIACGGMHTVVLEEDGTVWTFGVNDDQALGRTTKEEEDCLKPGRVEKLPKNIVQVTAGDSHSAALTSDGQVYAWGCFKDTNGNYGLIVNDGGVKCRTKPELITSSMTEKIKIVKMASGSHHIAMLSDDGRVYTCGTNDQGQLGRPEPVVRRVTRSMGNANANADAPSKRVFLLQPAKVDIGRNPKISDVWTGEFATLLSTRTNDIYVFGLNNYSQLGVANDGDKNSVLFKATKNTVFRGKTWKQIAGGQHHTLALDEDGKVYSIGRSTEGRLGLGPVKDDVVGEPSLVNTLVNHKCVQIAAGTSTSYAITEDGQLYAWGFGENFQLANGDDEDRNVPTLCHGGKKGGELKSITGKVVSATAGGQHVAIAVVSQPEMPNGH